MHSLANAGSSSNLNSSVLQVSKSSKAFMFHLYSTYVRTFFYSQNSPTYPALVRAHLKTKTDTLS